MSVTDSASHMYDMGPKGVKLIFEYYFAGIYLLFLTLRNGNIKSEPWVRYVFSTGGHERINYFFSIVVVPAIPTKGSHVTQFDHSENLSSNLVA